MKNILEGHNFKRFLSHCTKAFVSQAHSTCGHVLQERGNNERLVGCFPGGDTPSNELYRVCVAQKVWFLTRFGLKQGIDFAFLD